MVKIEMKFNGRKVTSAGQLQREMSKAVENHVTSSLKKAAGPGVRLKKTPAGYVAEGSPEAIERMKRKLR